MADEISKILYGETLKVKLADGNIYTMHEPDLDSLESIGFDSANLADLKNIKRLAYVMLKDESSGLTEKLVGKLITFKMMQADSDFMKVLLTLLGVNQKKTENPATA